METIHAAKVLVALGHETRMAIYRMLLKKGGVGSAAGSIGEALKLAPATLSFHLRELSQAGLIRARQQSRFIYYSTDGTTMKRLLAHLAENCCEASAAGPAPGPQPARDPPPTAKPVIRPKPRMT